jgi:PEP-CTERM motif
VYLAFAWVVNAPARFFDAKSRRERSCYRTRAANAMWQIQELSTGTFPYGFDRGIVATSSVPEPGTFALMVIGLAVGIPVLRRRSQA